MKRYEPLPRLTIPHEQASRLEEKRKAALTILATHKGTKRQRRWLGIPMMPRSKRPTKQQQEAAKFTARKGGH